MGSLSHRDAQYQVRNQFTAMQGEIYSMKMEVYASAMLQKYMQAGVRKLAMRHCDKFILNMWMNKKALFKEEQREKDS
jgi:hypothetical protein